tara:strand:- start:9008 stop:9550 length:543 start_codon:yes stop_codon:yes gene_type:complete
VYEGRGTDAHECEYPPDWFVVLTVPVGQLSRDGPPSGADVGNKEQVVEKRIQHWFPYGVGAHCLHFVQHGQGVEPVRDDNEHTITRLGSVNARRCDDHPKANKDDNGRSKDNVEEMFFPGRGARMACFFEDGSGKVEDFERKGLEGVVDENEVVFEIQVVRQHDEKQEEPKVASFHSSSL